MKFSLNRITAQKMTISLKTLRHFIIIVLACLMMLIIRASLLSSYLKYVAEPHYERRFAICKKFFHVSESSFSPSFLVLSVIVTFWSLHGEIFAELYYCPKDGQFIKHCHGHLVGKYHVSNIFESSQ